jgi:hypothetical protein
MALSVADARRDHRAMSQQDMSPMTELDLELAALTRAYAGVIQHFRIQWLDGEIRHGRVRVLHCRTGVFGDRLALVLDNGFILRLRLMQPLWDGLASLDSVKWNDDGRCVVNGSTSDGQTATCNAWLASLEKES